METSLHSPASMSVALVEPLSTVLSDTCRLQLSTASMSSTIPHTSNLVWQWTELPLGIIALTWQTVSR
ncbi:hypothetical protein MKX07_003095 [Trichoderma sp. CBMAI-0711]|nr:hypothetical protein MKX07_003095 [Trichoderma sp. CBMAI-0711]